MHLNGSPLPLVHTGAERPCVRRGPLRRRQPPREERASPTMQGAHKGLERRLQVPLPTQHRLLEVHGRRPTDEHGGLSAGRVAP
jgi:hypothetical protein